MKTDPSHHVGKRRTSKISDEQQQQMQRGWFTSVTSVSGGAGQRWRRQRTLVLLFSLVLFAGSFSSAVHAQEGGHASIAQAQKAFSFLPEGFTEGFAMTNGIRMHYVSGGMIAGSGHWIPEEQPQAFVARLLAFLNKK
jgi:hypothetical protein